MQHASKPDFLRPIERYRLQVDFPSGFQADHVFESEAFERLGPGGIALQGPLTVAARYDGKDRLQMAIEGWATIACARCLAPVRQSVSGLCRFRLFETEAQADQAVEALNPEEPVCDADGQSLRDLIEDELLIRFSEPYWHDDCAAPPIEAPGLVEDSNEGSGPLPSTDSGDRQRPFAGLEQLLAQKTTNKKS